jgi:hypothetical protein
MIDDAKPEPHFSLLGAIRNYCDPALITDLMLAERRLTESQHSGTGQPLLSAIANLRQPRRDEWMSSGARIPEFDRAWDRLIANFRELVERGSMELDGVQLKPVVTTERMEIPGDWAAMMRFDFKANAISTYEARYGSIRVYRKRPARAVNPALQPLVFPPAPSAEGPVALEPADVGSLSDEAIIRLLEEHGQRVVGGSDFPLIQPSKVSFGPILCRRMEWRAERGQLASSLAGECEELVRWLGTVIVHHQIPTARGAEAPLRDLYRRLKAGSTPVIA